METLNSYMERLEWRRSKVLELSSQGHTQPEISRILQIGIGTVNRDIFFLRQKAKTNIERYVNERLPEEYEKCLVGLTAILKEAWHMSNQVDIENKEKVQALSLAKECYTTKLELLTNATVVDDAIRFVSEHTNHEKPEKKLDDRKQEQDDNDNDSDNDNEIIETTTNITNNQVF